MKRDSKENYIITNDNKFIYLDSLLKKVPELIFLSPLHVDVCKKIAELKGYTGKHFKVYVNLLTSHSLPAKNITALIVLILRSDIDVININSSFASREILGCFIDLQKISFSKNNFYSYSFFNKKTKKKLLAKTLIHKLYRIFFKTKINSKRVIRSWVEITHKMYAEHYDDSLILIYPFYLNLPRHIKYSLNCFKNYKLVSLCGLPYKLVDLMNVFLAKDIDASYVRFELNAYINHASELAQMSADTIYTSDEFEAGSIVMVEKFRELGGIVINKAHGLSFGSPYLAYNKFTVYNFAQKKYYSKNSPSTNFEVSPRINAGENDMLKVDVSSEYILVYIEANFRRFGIIYETFLEEKAIQILRKISNERNIKAVVKAHPNRNTADYAEYSQSCGVEVIKHLKEINGTKPIFITVASAAYYDFKQFGPFIFIDDEYSDLRDFYGEEVDCFTLSNLEKGVLALMQLGL